jgi:hypothetical protein
LAVGTIGFAVGLGVGAAVGSTDGLGDTTGATEGDGPIEGDAGDTGLGATWPTGVDAGELHAAMAKAATSEAARMSLGIVQRLRMHGRVDQRSANVE